MTLAAGGFGLCGIPENLIQALKEAGTKGSDHRRQQCRRRRLRHGSCCSRRVRSRKSSPPTSARTRNSNVRCSPANSNSNSRRRARWPRRLRAGGAGIPGFYTRTAFGTKLAEKRETKDFDGKEYVLEPAITADVSIVKAWKGDKFGNLVYRKTARNFNPMIATCGKVTVAEVEELVETGELEPDQIHTPGIYVDRIIQGENYEKRIEFRTVTGGAPSRARNSPVARQMAQPRREGTARRLLRQSRHRHPDARGELHSVRHQRDAAVGERPARHRPVPDSRIRSIRISSTRASRPSPRCPAFELLLERRLVRDDPRRPHRSLDPRRPWKSPRTATSPTGWCPARW